MDLGFGSANQVIGEATKKAIINAKLTQEAAVDEQIAQYDALLNASSDTLEAIRAKRLAGLKRARLLQHKWRAMGHGTYEALGEGQHAGEFAKEFFEAAKRSDRLVVHFHRRTTRMCDVFHRHLETVSQQHLETRFVKMDVEAGGSADYLVEKLGIVIMPTLLIVKDRKVVHHVRGFDELGNTENFSARALEYVLGMYGGVIQKEDGDNEPPEELLNNSSSGVNRLSMKEAPRRSTVRTGGFGTSCDDFEDHENGE